MRGKQGSVVENQGCAVGSRSENNGFLDNVEEMEISEDGNLGFVVEVGGLADDLDLKTVAAADAVVGK